MQQETPKKMVIGWFSFTCCEDSTILFTELLNDHLDDWKKLVEFRHIKALKTKNELRDLDVAFIEGAVSSDAQAEEEAHVRRADQGQLRRGFHRPTWKCRQEHRWEGPAGQVRGHQGRKRRGLQALGRQLLLVHQAAPGAR